MKDIFVKIALSIIVFLIILYKEYQFGIDLNSIPFILIYIVMLVGYILYYKDKFKK